MKTRWQKSMLKSHLCVEIRQKPEDVQRRCEILFGDSQTIDINDGTKMMLT